MTLLAELARLLRLMDPMPPRVLTDAEAARHHLPPRPGESIGPAADTELVGPPPDVVPGQARNRRTPPRLTALDPLVLLFDTVPAVRCAGRRLGLGRPGEDPVLDLEIRHVGPALRIAGLAPPGGRLRVRHATGTARVPVNDAGYFTAEVPTGPIRLLLTEPGGRTRASGWL